MQMWMNALRVVTTATHMLSVPTTLEVSRARVILVLLEMDRPAQVRWCNEVGCTVLQSCWPAVYSWSVMRMLTFVTAPKLYLYVCYLWCFKHKLLHERGRMFTLKFTLTFLTDVNECTSGGHNCDTNAQCTNTPGTFTCSCNAGFTGNGQTCSGKVIP